MSARVGDVDVVAEDASIFGVFLDEGKGKWLSTKVTT